MSKLFDFSSLAMIPTAYKDGKLYSIRPTDGDGDFDFSRGSNLAATRVDVNGLIEKGRENLLLQSNTFDTTWVNTNTTETSGQSGYDGSSDAWLLTKTAAFGQIKQSISSSGVHTFSVYAKEGTSGWMRLVIIGTANPSAYFNLSNGAVGVTSNVISANSQDIGSGWYRYSISINQSSITEARIYPAEGDNDISGTSGNIYIQDSQLEAGLVATDYIETGATSVSAGILEDMPRLDYSGGASCPALLLEPQRTNLITQSEYFESWNNNDILFDFGYSAPDGTNSAYKITKNGTQSYLYLTGISAADDSRSIYARTTSGTGQVNLTSHNSNSNSLFTITEEWQRFEVTSTPLISGNYYAVDFRAGDLDEVIIWGAQQEVGSYPTSYIPTMGASVTRSFDNAGTRTDMQDFLGTDTGAWFMHLDEFYFDVTGTGLGAIILAENGQQATSIELVQDGQFQYKVTINNSTAVQDLDGEDKLLMNWSDSFFKIFVNGVNVYTSASGQYSHAFSHLILPQTTRAPHIKIKQISFFPTALTDSECIALTTL